jgi:hypothetical protein
VTVEHEDAPAAWGVPLLDRVIYAAEEAGIEIPEELDPRLDPPTLTPAGNAAGVKQFLDRLTSGLKDLSIFRRNIIYSNLSYWKNSLGSPGWGADCDLWIAAWGTTSPIVPYPWTAWHFHQYTSDGVGATYGVQSSRIDLNHWNGTAVSLAAYRIPRKAKAVAVDLLPYLKGDGRMYEVLHPPRPDNPRPTETLQTQVEDGIFYQVKNSQWEQLKADNQWIMRGWDTSPGPAPDYAERPGHLRIYHQYEPGADFARWCPRYMTVGQTWNGPGHLVQFYYKDHACTPSAANSGNATNKMTFFARHASKTWNGITVNDVIEIGSPGGERFWFGKNFGLCAWQSSWGESAICEILTGRPSLVREVIPCL